MDSATLIRDARSAAGFTQGELARRMRTTQSAVARLESPGSNPRLDTLARALHACDRELTLTSRPASASVDESLVAERVRLTPEQRITSFERSYEDLRELALAGARSRRELA